MTEKVFKEIVYQKIRDCDDCYVRHGAPVGSVEVLVCESHNPDDIQYPATLCTMCGDEITDEDSRKRDFDGLLYHKVCYNK